MSDEGWPCPRGSDAGQQLHVKGPLGAIPQRCERRAWSGALTRLGGVGAHQGTEISVRLAGCVTSRGGRCCSHYS